MPDVGSPSRECLVILTVIFIDATIPTWPPVIEP